MTDDLNFISNNIYNRSIDFFGTDTAALFQTNCLKQSSDWHYRNQPIVYRFNKQGFRSSLDYDNVDWQNAVVILGCSNMMGVGLAESETLDYQIKMQTGLDVVNLAVSGSSVDVSLYNATVLKRKANQVKAVIVGWTNINRFLTFDSDQTPRNHGPWDCMSTTDFKYFEMYMAGADIHARYKKLIFNELWRNVPTLEFTFFENANETLGCEFYRIEDYSRDIHEERSHPGKHTISKVSSDVINFLLGRPYVPHSFKISRFI